MHPRLFNLLVNELQTRRLDAGGLERLLSSATPGSTPRARGSTEPRGAPLAPPTP
jgi:hypothetical protein